MFKLEAIEPSPQLAPVVERFFLTEATIPADLTIDKILLPSVMQSILLNMNGTPQIITAPQGEPQTIAGHLVLGQFTKSFTASLSGSIDFIGIHFKPTGLYRLIKEPMMKFTNTIHSLNTSEWNQLTTELQTLPTEARMQSIEQWLMKRLTTTNTEYALAEKAASNFISAQGAASVESVCRQVGLSERTMQRHFLKYIGVSPKSFNRIVRFHAVTKLIESNATIDWKNIFFETGYADHAHFVHDFKNITGMSPTAYYHSKTDYEKFFYGS